MKKMTIVALAAMLSASMAFAGMGVNWSQGGWMVAHDGDLDDGPGGAENNAVLWQFIYAGDDNVMGDVSLDASKDYLSGDDQLLASRLVPQGGGSAADGTKWDNWLIMDSGNPNYEDLTWSADGKYVYQRLFEGETPAAGMYYFETDLFEYTKTYDTGSAMDDFFFDPEGAGVKFNKQIPGEPVIPEPATMSLLGLGALAMVIRRKLRK